VTAALREAGPPDAVLGLSPKVAVEPASVPEAAEALRALAADRLAVVFVGGGTDLELGAPPSRLDAVVHTRRLSRIREHTPADQIVAVEAGITIAELQRALAAHGQRLALDPPHPERTTAGGAVAANAFGPRRTRYGSVRDLVIGVTLVRADGVVARGGGKVVKNVAGFDLPKVACGSLGTLGLIATAAFRLHPLPEATATVLVPGVRAEAVVALIAAARTAQLEPASVVALGTADHFDLGVRFEGFGRGVAQQVARVVELAGATGATPAQLADEAAATFWRRHDAIRAAAPLRVRVAALPTRFPAVAARLVGLGELAWYATLGLGFAGGAVGDVAATTTAVTAARAALVAEGGSLVVEAAPAELRAAVDPWGPIPPSFAIMERLKRRFDPEGRLNPGRFVGGL
jgi:glycolate oxidase FAD binding subunit